VALSSGVKETRASAHPTQSGVDGVSRLLSLVDRSGPPHRSVGGLIVRWYAASGTTLLFDEWADPAASHLATVFDRESDVGDVEDAVVAFAQARAGASHPVEAVTSDLVALVRAGWPTGRGTWGEALDPVGLMARALGAWAAEHTTASSCRDCLDAATGLASSGYVRERVRELHDQCRALAISPPVTFGALVVQLELGALRATERMEVRAAAGRVLTARFRAGETVAALSPARMAVVMPAYGLDRAIHSVTADLAEHAALDGVDVTVGRVAFGIDADATVRSLGGTSVGS
jgi:hypothetical protein